MAQRYHIKQNGEPAYCSASIHACPRGGVDQHYDSPAEARAGFERQMVAELFPQGVQVQDLPMRDLNQLAKVSPDVEIINEAIHRGSERTLKNLSRNANLNVNQVIDAWKAAKDETTRDALAHHVQFPVSLMTGPQFAAVLKEDIPHVRREQIADDNFVRDEHLAAVENSWPVGSYIIGRALANPNNGLSANQVRAFAELNYLHLGSALRSLRYPADRIPELPAKLISWSNIDNTDDPAYLYAYADWCVKNIDANTREAEYNAGHVAQNVNAPPAALDRIAALAPEQVYVHPNTSDSTRARLRAENPAVARMAHVHELQQRFHGNLEAEIVQSRRAVNPFGRNRGLTDTTVQFNLRRLEELNMDSNDVMTFMNVRQFNGGARFDPSTGIFTGTTDSTD